MSTPTPSHMDSAGVGDKNDKQKLVVVKMDYKASLEETLEFLKEILDKLSSRFTKKYLTPIENSLQENHYFIPVEFFERKNKLPVPEHKVVIIFKVGRSWEKDEVSFQIENESVSYQWFNSIKLSFFESLLDKVLWNKYRMYKALHLQSNFEHTRIIDLSGENKKWYTLEEEENIFSNNRSEYYKYEGCNFKFKKIEVADIDKIIKEIWKTLVANNEIINDEIIDMYSKKTDKDVEKEKREKAKTKEKKDGKKLGDIKEETNEQAQQDPNKRNQELEMSFEQFKLLFEYGKLKMNEENMHKLWKYTNKNNTPTITYEEFVNFGSSLVNCLSAYSIAMHKHNNNNCFINKIKNCVEIMNLHFKEYDTDNNQEISYENLKKCLLKENEWFTRKEIEIILQQINPESSFQYWKFDRILTILYNKYFNYQKLMSEDKIYNYLIKIFSKQDPYKEGKLHYKKMRQAFLTEDKINFSKTEILLLLNLFDINTSPEIEYYSASLLLRNIVDYLVSSDIVMQKIDITQPMYMVYENYEDNYDRHCKQIKPLFIEYDKDFDHVLSKEEFRAFMEWWIPYLDDGIFEETFAKMDKNKDGVWSYQEFKSGFKELMERTRISNVIREMTILTMPEQKEEVKDKEKEKEATVENEGDKKD